jgi:putative chemoreceptor
VFIKYGNETFKEEIAQIHPEMDVQSLTTYGVPHATNENNIATMWVLLPIFPVTVIVFIIRHRILKLLSRQTILSEQSKKLHRNLLKALTLQALLPPLYILGIFLFMADISLGLHHYLLEYGMYTLCSIIPIVSPLSPLYFVSPYRKYVLGLFFKTPEKVVPVQAFFTASSGSTNQGVQPQTVSTGVQTMLQ